MTTTTTSRRPTRRRPCLAWRRRPRRRLATRRRVPSRSRPLRRSRAKWTIAWPPWCSCSSRPDPTTSSKRPPASSSPALKLEPKQQHRADFLPPRKSHRQKVSSFSRPLSHNTLFSSLFVFSSSCLWPSARRRPNGCLSKRARSRLAAQLGRHLASFFGAAYARFRAIAPRERPAEQSRAKQSEAKKATLRRLPIVAALFGGRRRSGRRRRRSRGQSLSARARAPAFNVMRPLLRSFARLPLRRMFAEAMRVARAREPLQRRSRVHARGCALRCGASREQCGRRTNALCACCARARAANSSAMPAARFNRLSGCLFRQPPGSGWSRRRAQVQSGACWPTN